jgi:tight adherence protein B
MSSIILYLVLVVAFFALIQGCLLFAADIREEARITATYLRLRRPTLADGVSPWLRDILLTAPIRRFDNLVQTCGIRTSTERVLLGMTIFAVLAVFLSDALTRSPFLSFAGGLAVGIGLPLFILRRLRASRMTQLTRQLPETLDMMVRSLRAGHPIPACISLIAKEMRAPIGTEFKRVYDAMSYGLDLKDALTKMTDRLDGVSELKYIVSAIKIQSSSGGNLAEILSSLSKLMRDQLKLKMKVKAISAEGRLSGNILAALPIIVVALLNFINPKYYESVMSNNGMVYAMGIALAIIVVGYFLIRRIVDIQV